MIRVKVTATWTYEVNMEHYPECETPEQALELDRDMYDSGEVDLEDILPPDEEEVLIKWELIKDE